MPANATRTTPDGAPPRRPRARPGEGERLREQILDAATGLLVRSGDERTVSVRSVAKEVGCTPAALYLHFADRDEMIFAVCERQFARLARRIDAAMEGLDDPLDALRAIGRAYIAFGLEHPEEYRVLFMGHPSGLPAGATPESLLDSGGFDRVVDVASACIAAGVIPDGDPFATATGLWVVVHGITSLMISKPWFPWPEREAFVDEMLDRQIRGMGR